jgi:hypothetical protein
MGGRLPRLEDSDWDRSIAIFPSVLSMSLINNGVENLLLVDIPTAPTPLSTLELIAVRGAALWWCYLTP